jgi:hypothetical protein
VDQGCLNGRIGLLLAPSNRFFILSLLLANRSRPPIFNATWMDACMHVLSSRAIRTWPVFPSLFYSNNDTTYYLEINYSIDRVALLRVRACMDYSYVHIFSNMDTPHLLALVKIDLELSLVLVVSSLLILLLRTICYVRVLPPFYNI